MLPFFKNFLRMTLLKFVGDLILDQCFYVWGGGKYFFGILCLVGPLFFYSNSFWLHFYVNVVLTFGFISFVYFCISAHCLSYGMGKDKKSHYLHLVLIYLIFVTTVLRLGFYLILRILFHRESVSKIHEKYTLVGVPLQLRFR